jgi:hypothetical protein
MVEELQSLARKVTESLDNIDKKQLRYNDIVRVATLFYPSNPTEGVIELTQSCAVDSHLYVKKQPMWLTLETQYQWMIR